MAATLDNLRKEFQKLLGCCLHYPVWTPDDVSSIIIGVQSEYAGWTVVEGPYVKDIGSESESYTIVQLTDGNLGLLEEGEDYTGHGCMCGSFTGKYASLMELLESGITNNAAREVIHREVVRK